MNKWNPFAVWFIRTPQEFARACALDATAKADHHSRRAALALDQVKLHCALAETHTLNAARHREKFERGLRE